MTFTDAEQRAVLGRCGWPYGANRRDALAERDALIRWALAGGWALREPGARCLHWVADRARHCSALRARSHPGQVDVDRVRIGVLDHVTFWQRHDAALLLLAQPYGLDGLDELRRVAAECGDLVVTVLPNAAPWYGEHGVFVHGRDVEIPETGGPA